MIANPATPPTTPPAMGPAFELEELLDVGELLDDGEVLDIGEVLDVVELFDVVELVDVGELLDITKLLGVGVAASEIRLTDVLLSSSRSCFVPQPTPPSVLLNPYRPCSQQKYPPP